MAESKLGTEDRFEWLFSMGSAPGWINIRDVCPVAFNRGNGKSKLSAQHALKLMKTIVNDEDFQDHRYNMVWVKLPNPQDPTELVVLANKECKLDRRLPSREVKPMAGAMKANHLICVLLMQIHGGRTLLGTEMELTTSMGNEAQQRALEKGLRCITWSHSDVMVNLADFKLLMASDNKDADTAMPDSELHVIGSTLVDIATTPIGVGQTLEKVIMELLCMYASSCWSFEDRTVFIDFAKITSQISFDFILAFANLVTDFGLFTVPVELFRLILTVTTMHQQWIRVMWLCRLYTADWTSECNKYKDKLQPKNLSKIAFATFVTCKASECARHLDQCSMYSKPIYNNISMYSTTFVSASTFANCNA